MIATRIRQRLETETIRIPNAAEFIGKEVEIIVLIEPSFAGPVGDNPRKRIRGSAKGQVWIAPDFDDPLPESVVRDFHKGLIKDRHLASQSDPSDPEIAHHLLTFP